MLYVDADFHPYFLPEMSNAVRVQLSWVRRSRLWLDSSFHGDESC